MISNSDSFLSEKYSLNQLSKAIKELINFKNSLKKKEKRKIKEKIYIIKNDFIRYLSNKLKIDFNQNLEEIEDGFTEIINNKIIKEEIDLKKIKLINEVEEIESDNFEIVNENFLQLLGVNEKILEDKGIIFKKIKNEKQQIIFKDKTKLNILIKGNKKILHVIESPTISKNDNNSFKEKPSLLKEKISEDNNNEDVKYSSFKIEHSAVHSSIRNEIENLNEDNYVNNEGILKNIIYILYKFIYKGTFIFKIKKSFS